MRQYGAFKFSSPRGYSDWTQYAGFDRKTGMVPGGVAPSAGLMPVAPGRSDGRTLQQQFTDAGAAIQQAAQGNFSQAYGTMFGQQTPAKPAVPTPPVLPTQQPQPQAEDPNLFDYLSGLGR